MKKFLPGCVVLAMAATGSAGIIFSDGFNYGIGPADIVGAPGSYWGETAPASVPTMIYTNDQLRISFQANQDINAPLQDAPYASGGPVAALYSSFTIRFVALPTAVGTYIAHFRDVSGLGFRGRVFVSTTNAAAGHYRIGIANAASTTRAAWQIPADLSLNTAYFIVFRFTNSLPAQWSDFNDQGTVQGDFKVVTLSGVLGGAGNRFLELRKP